MIISTVKGSNHLAPDASYLSSKPVSSQVDSQINSWTFLNYVTISTTWIDFMVDFAYNRKDDFVLNTRNLSDLSDLRSSSPSASSHRDTLNHDWT